ncbi:MAG: multidrug efflux RND transporter permease subunit [Deltaproteobacteria bacterium]|nr:multidrug efflux RND transporter permease subunit [Deltaproteobacteria bacterium]
MTLSAAFIRRPVATSLLTLAVALAGAIAFQHLPVAPLPQVEFPTIQVSASLPGASPETMASAVAMPLERMFGRIAGVTEMTSTSGLGATQVTLQFDLGRSIDSAARDVQAAINAARGQLPAALPNNPYYRKVNPADAPIAVMSLTSDTLPPSRLYDAAASVLQQELAQVEGVGQVFIGGSALPAVRVELNPTALTSYGIGFDEVRAVLGAANSNRPVGEIATTARAWNLDTDGQLMTAAEYRPLVVRYRDGAVVRIRDVAEVRDAVEDVRTVGFANGKPAVMAVIFRKPGANIIATMDRIRARLPYLRAVVPRAVDLDVVIDRSASIRASVHDVEIAMAIAIALVILVVFLFLRDLRATAIPSVVVPLSLIGTFGAMYLLDYSIDNLSLMALTISTGFVVDDAIVVLENVMRHLERGASPREAALGGAREIAFTVLSMSVSLVAVFIPILLMGGIVGRLFREFAVVLSLAVLISLVVSLTTTPMMCAQILRRGHGARPAGRPARAAERVFGGLHRAYERSLAWTLAHPRFTLLVAGLMVALNVHLYGIVPKGFFPQQDTGRLVGNVQADQAASFQAMQGKLGELVDIVRSDPAVETVVAFTGGSQGSSTGRMFVALKPLAERKASGDVIAARLRPKLASVAGASLFLQPVQDIRIGGRPSGALYQFTLQGDDLDDLEDAAPKVLAELRTMPILTDVNSDQMSGGLQTTLAIDRATAARLGVTTQMIDDALYDAFGQRQVSTIYTALNQYHVVMGVAPSFWQRPETLRDVYVRAANGTPVPLAAFARIEPGTAALAVTHQGQFPATTVSFNLAPGVALGEAVDAITAAVRELDIPPGVRATFAGTAQAFQASLANQPLLILAALVAVYIVLGILYESYIHPLTILSTLPSAGVGAILALLVTGGELNVIALIGIILLIGIVKKNAILMIDFALEAERRDGKAPEEAIYEACLLRFRPIMMTTMAALLGGLPLALGAGMGSELRRPLGITIVGGLLVSQILTLYTTPVVYLYLDRLSLWWKGVRSHGVALAVGRLNR